MSGYDRVSSRFGTNLEPVVKTSSTPQSRTPNYVRYCGKEAPELPLVATKLMDQAAKEGHYNMAASVIYAYTQESPLYKEVNEALRCDNARQLAKYGGFIRELQTALYNECDIKRNNFDNVEPVWRGATFAPSEIARYRPGFTFLWASFVSTSKSESVARDIFKGNVLFKIKVQGKGIIYALDIARFSKFQNEQEVLLFPFSGFEVLKVTKESSELTVIEMQSVDTLLIDNYGFLEDLVESQYDA